MIPVILQGGALLAAVLMQIAWFSHVRPFGVMPNLVLVVVVVTALWSRATAALASAIVAGLLLDLASGADFGLRTAFFTVVTLAVIALRQLGVYAESFLMAVATVAICTVIANLLIVFGVVGTTGGVDWLAVLQRISIEVGLNTVLLAILFGIRELTQDRRARISAELRRGSWL